MPRDCCKDRLKPRDWYKDRTTFFGLPNYSFTFNLRDEGVNRVSFQLPVEKTRTGILKGLSPVFHWLRVRFPEIPVHTIIVVTVPTSKVSRGSCLQNCCDDGTHLGETRCMTRAPPCTWWSGTWGERRGHRRNVHGSPGKRWDDPTVVDRVVDRVLSESGLHLIFQPIPPDYGTVSLTFWMGDRSGFRDFLSVSPVLGSVKNRGCGFRSKILGKSRRSFFFFFCFFGLGVKNL